VKVDGNIRLQCKYRGLRIIANPIADPLAWGILNSTFSLVKAFPVFVKEQVGGSKVDRILQLLGRGLIGMGQTAGVGLQIHLDFTLAYDVARAWVVFKSAP